MTISRKSLANSIDAYDTQIAELQDGKRETFELYRGELFDAGMGKDAVKAEIDAVKKAIRRRQLIAKKSAEVVENADALADEIFAEISALRAPRATRVETIDEFDPETGEIAESDLAETRPSGRGKAESASGEAPDTAPQSSEAIVREMRSEWPDRQEGLPVVRDTRAFIKQLRPHCQNPDACGGQGKSHCFSCSVKIKDDPLEAA